MCMYVRMYVRTYIHTYMHTYMCMCFTVLAAPPVICTHTYTGTQVLCTYVCMYIPLPLLSNSNVQSSGMKIVKHILSCNLNAVNISSSKKLTPLHLAAYTVSPVCHPHSHAHSHHFVHSIILQSTCLCVCGHKQSNLSYRPPVYSDCCGLTHGPPQWY